jgi:polyferredoxin
MGIDIRDGAQLECINCGLCIDACNEIMPKVERPLNLIAYDTDFAVSARMAGQKGTYQIIRPRTIFYAAVLAFVGGLMIYGVMNRHMTDLHVLRDRNPTFVTLHDGAVRDGYTIKIDNRTFEKRTFLLSLEGIPEATLRTPGDESDSHTHVMPVVVEANEVRAIRVSIIAPPASITADNMPVAFTVRSGELFARAPTVFLSGAANAR